jgi:hypothetical protein
MKERQRETSKGGKPHGGWSSEEKAEAAWGLAFLPPHPGLGIWTRGGVFPSPCKQQAYTFGIRRSTERPSVHGKCQLGSFLFVFLQYWGLN